MEISDIKIEPSLGPLVRATAAQVDELEARLWITFPAGYREYVTELGEGEMGEFVKIYPPWRIDRELADWRDRIKKYWVWDKGTDLLPKARALECVIVGDTGNGGELVFHPRYPDRLFVLGGRGSGSDGRILVAGSDLLSAIEWMVTSGKLTRRFKDRTLRPFDSRTEEREAPEVADPPGSRSTTSSSSGANGRGGTGPGSRCPTICPSARARRRSSTKRSCSTASRASTGNSRATLPSFASTSPTARFASTTVTS